MTSINIAINEDTKLVVKLIIQKHEDLNPINASKFPNITDSEVDQAIDEMGSPNGREYYKQELLQMQQNYQKLENDYKEIQQEASGIGTVKTVSRYHQELNPINASKFPNITDLEVDRVIEEMRARNSGPKCNKEDYKQFFLQKQNKYKELQNKLADYSDLIIENRQNRDNSSSLLSWVYAVLTVIKECCKNIWKYFSKSQNSDQQQLL